MRNPKTTLIGYIALAGAVLSAVAQLMNGDLPNLSDLLAALTGAGLVLAADAKS